MERLRTSRANESIGIHSPQDTGSLEKRRYERVGARFLVVATFSNILKVGILQHRHASDTCVCLFLFAEK